MNKADIKRRNKFHKEKINALYGKDIISHMQRMSEMESARREYFCFCSQLWRAIEEHTVHDKDCVLIDRENPVVVHSSGVGLSLLKTHSYRGEWVTKHHSPDFSESVLVPAKNFSMEFEVEYCPANEDSDNNSYRKTYYLSVPVALEQNFTQKAFDEWVAGLKKVRDAETRKEELAQLKKLQDKYKGVL